jgi:phage gp29-like protein
MHWSDVIWMMGQAVFRGFAVHEVVWKREGSYLLPEMVLDRPQRRFNFGQENELRLKTRTNPVEGIELGQKKWLLTRHMPSQENPYGVAVYSSCFWPYTFKHSGFRFFVKFAEKYGLPWAIGRYPQGAIKDDQDALADALRNMVEDAIAAIPQGSEVELLSTDSGKAAVHENLINLCNREMSKALTSQTLATEIQGEGSRAASETHREREVSVNESDRQIISDTFNELFAWITELNVANAKPPKFEFWEEGEARKEWVEVIDGARKFLAIPSQFAYERLQIPMPADGEDVLPSPTQNAAASGGGPEFSAHACPDCGSVHDFNQADFPDQAELEKMLEGIDDQELQGQAEAMLQPLFDVIAKHGPDEALGYLAEAYPDMDDRRLQDLLARVLFVADTWGRLNA